MVLILRLVLLFYFKLLFLLFMGHPVPVPGKNGKKWGADNFWT